MYHRFSLLYLGMVTGRTSLPTAFQTQGHRTEAPSAWAVAPADELEFLAPVSGG